ncbi:hypothetical protein CcCBS67573_g09481 [Chytriomyces confervae]|uniref:Crinkler effector protein N-terminal domain-containing protein n=1 Tax=Chytriomyces confervae TaxID=246404 RepID=A0A507DUC0_9FUNG|nr:hypothetical protein CcCBS67573_g09481 [Chytriomyces confervae]
MKSFRPLGLEYYNLCNLYWARLSMDNMDIQFLINSRARETFGSVILASSPADQDFVRAFADLVTDEFLKGETQRLICTAQGPPLPSHLTTLSAMVLWSRGVVWHYFAFSHNNKLSRIVIKIKSTHSVYNLKQAIREAGSPELDKWGAYDLILVRIYKGGEAKSGGLSENELEKWPECLRLESYGEKPEYIIPDQSMSDARPGNCLVRGDLYFKVMNSAEDLSEYFSPPLGKNVHHVLALVPQETATAPSSDIVSSKRPKYEPVTQPILVNPNTYSDTEPLFKLDSDYLAESGLKPTKLVLFCRKLFHDQFKFLRERVMRESRFGWILGPPGTGKSTTSLAFVSVMPIEFPEWTVTWIHLSRFSRPVCVRFVKRQKWTYKIKNDMDMQQLTALLDEVEGNHMVFLDGFVVADNAHMAIQKCCNGWLLDGIEKRRLVVVCSMSSRGKTNIDDDAVNRVEEFFVYSWELKEYLDAAMHPAFMNSVQPNLDSSALLDADLSTVPLVPQESILSKYHFAGGSSRYMFGYNTDKVIEVLQKSVEAVQDVSVYLKGFIGEQSDNVVNRLFSCYLKNPRSLFERTKTVVVSKYAVNLLATRKGPDLIRSLADTTGHYGNASLNGWFFESWFFASLRKGGLTVYGNEPNPECWQAPRGIETLDLANIAAIPEEGTWWKPLKWNQGGYVAIFTERLAQRFTFVQVTAGGTHSLKLQFFVMFLRELAESAHSYEILDLRIIFLVPRTKVESFAITNVTSEGCLDSFEGWNKGRERERVEIWGVDGFM